MKCSLRSQLLALHLLARLITSVITREINYLLLHFYERATNGFDRSSLKLLNKTHRNIKKRLLQNQDEESPEAN